MKVTGFDGKEYNWQLAKFKRKKKKASKPHKRASELIRSMFPLMVVLEEATIPGSETKRRRSKLYCDFFLPELRLMVEVHGRQHYEHTHFFHTDKQSFGRAKARDREKIEWCELNDIDLVELPATETDEEWRERLENV